MVRAFVQVHCPRSVIELLLLGQRRHQRVRNLSVVSVCIKSFIIIP